MNDVGTLCYFLGLEVTFDVDGYYLSQANYAFDILFRLGLRDSKMSSNSLKTNVKLLATNGEPLTNATLYKQFVDSFIYLAVTWPNISYVVDHLVS
jgi:hypothetical protein